MFRVYWLPWFSSLVWVSTLTYYVISSSRISVLATYYVFFNLPFVLELGCNRVLFLSETMRHMVKCSTPSCTREEDLAKEIEAKMVSRPESKTASVGKRSGTHQGSSAKGGAIMLDQVAKTAWSNATTVENSATTRSAERRNIKAKNERSVQTLQTFKNEVEKKTGRHFWCLRLGRGKEYFSD